MSVVRGVLALHLQVAANEYLGATGISSHVEEPTAFGANLGTLSLLAPIEMTLMPANQDSETRCNSHGCCYQSRRSAAMVPTMAIG